MNEKEITIDLKTGQKPLYFRDVGFDGFFINKHRQLCQRFSDLNSYNIIADENGTNCDRINDIKPNECIDRLVSIKFLL